MSILRNGLIELAKEVAGTRVGRMGQCWTVVEIDVDVVDDEPPLPATKLSPQKQGHQKSVSEPWATKEREALTVIVTPPSIEGLRGHVRAASEPNVGVRGKEWRFVRDTVPIDELRDFVSIRRT